MTDLGLPTVPKQTHTELGGDIGYALTGQHFTIGEGVDVASVAATLAHPLSVIVQVTKRCDMDCGFCSETMQKPDPTLRQLATMEENLRGVIRVFLSGGEPLLRRDFIDIVDMYSEHHIVAVPTNATHGLQHAKGMAGKVAYANIGLEGPRATVLRVRGDYDKEMKGVRAFQEAGIPLALSSVVYRSTLSALPFTIQIADVLDATKVKFILPLRKGNALKLPEHEFISQTEAEDAFTRLKEARAEHMWAPALRLTTWTPQNEGHMIVIEPDGFAQAWPVYDAPDLWEPLGNVLQEPISAIWERYRFKENHVSKYVGRSIHAVPRAA
ncbi:MULTISPECIES: radical SAM protein [unclassified Streptomyces]|uniref:radical SAM protein n=1 Tax=unclassified Streptomyces TaxID=2593676 RepID=UPI00081E3562|nr:MULTISPECIES: radical SAM protein [unclassified Streptomyces]MYZ37971.1 radical SAM protein [Streptomyces sp. SID4917]SCF95452.1 Radical SAM superfamily enzyme, MoaA/NifB/PqqE/SkfB family [Streptomyces sp. MnatMP-M17]